MKNNVSKLNEYACKGRYFMDSVNVLVVFPIGLECLRQIAACRISSDDIF